MCRTEDRVIEIGRQTERGTEREKKKKVFAERRPPISWAVIVWAHNKRGKVIQIVAQMCSPGICFSILSSDVHKRSRLCTWALNISLTGFLGRTRLTLSNACKIEPHNARSLLPQCVCIVVVVGESAGNPPAPPLNQVTPCSGCDIWELRAQINIAPTSWSNPFNSD